MFFEHAHGGGLDEHIFLRPNVGDVFPSGSRKRALSTRDSASDTHTLPQFYRVSQKEVGGKKR